MNDKAIETMVALADKRRLARLWYQKVTEKAPTERVVEAYCFLEHRVNLMVQAFQLDPSCDGSAWRCFRLDRIMDVSDGGGEFKPRRAVSLPMGDVSSWAKLFAMEKDTVEAKYLRFLREAVSDHQLKEAETFKARDFAEKLPTARVKVVHAKVFSEVLDDALLDGQISEEEEQFIDDVRGMMEEIGWAP